MATRGHIVVKIKEEDKGKTVHFDPSLIPLACTYTNEYLNKLQDVVLDKNYILIYHHFDSYPEGLGRTLVGIFNDYKTILNLLLAGDASSINGREIKQYCTFRKDERWEYTKPQLTDKCPSNEEDYTYLFDGDKWWFKSYKDTEWYDLKDALTKGK